MKTYLTAAAMFLLGISLVGAGWSLYNPAEIQIQKSEKVLDYTQNGAFDYTVTMKPSYFYNDVQPPEQEPLPQIPIKFIRDFSLTYYFRPADGTTKDIEINAILENPGSWKKTINLVPKGAGLSVFIPVDLAYFQDLADTIEKELGVSAGSHDVSIQAIVSGGTGPAINQLLPIRMTRSFIKMGDILTYSGGEGVGEFKYSIKLKENTLFGETTLTPPEFSQQNGVVLGPGDTIFTRFIDSVKVDYSFALDAGTAVKQARAQVRIEAIAENPGKWNKTFVLLPETSPAGNISLSFPLNLGQFNTVFDAIQQESGVSASSEDLTLQATVNVLAETDYGTINKTFVQRIKTNLREGVMTWSGDMKKSEPGSIEIGRTFTEPVRVLGMPVLWLRIFFFALAGFSVAGLGLSLTVYPRFFQTVKRPLPAVQNVGKKYRSIIVEVRQPPDPKPDETVIPLDSFDDLIKVAQSQLKPVLHSAHNGQERYWVNDGFVRYEYALAIRESLAEEGASKENT